MAEATAPEAIPASLPRRILLANVVAGAFVTVYLDLTLPAAPGEDVEVPWGDFVLLALFLLGFWVLATVLVARRINPSFEWVGEGRAPTKAEREVLVDLPALLARRHVVWWSVAAVVGAALNWHTGHGPANHVRVFVAVVLGGLTTAALTYFLAERALRPLVQTALAGTELERSRVGTSARLVLAWALGSGIPLVAIALIPLGWEDGRTTAPWWVGVVFMAVVGLLAGALLAVVAARSVAEPVASVRAGMARVQAGDLEVEVPVDDTGDVGLLQSGFNRMVTGLRERARLHDLFGRHVGAEVAQRAMESGVELGGETREVSVLFVDLIGSTAMAERQSATAVVATLNRFFDAVVVHTTREGGWVNKFEGDGALCVFGAPVTQADHAARALRAARALATTLCERGLDAGIGISSGEVVAGNVGAEHRYEYTVIGRPVNEAARLTDAAKRHPRRVLASAATVAAAADEARHWLDGGALELRGVARPVPVAAPAG